MQREKRTLTRRQFHYPAQVDFCDGTPLRPCQLTDVSEGGARITIELPEAIPQQFALLLAEGGKAQRWCSIAWRSKREVGVQFLPCPSKNKVSSQLAKLDV